MVALSCSGIYLKEFLMDIVFEEMFEEMEVNFDFDDELNGGQESTVDFLDDYDDDGSLEL
jgi:hypothetical protein